MSSLQADFLAALEALAPDGITPRRQEEWANTGAIYFQTADFQTLLGVAYNFQDGYASFNLTEITESERKATGARGTGIRPHDMTWLGWGYVVYAKGELREVLDGVAYLLRTRVT